MEKGIYTHVQDCTTEFFFHTPSTFFFAVMCKKHALIFERR